MDCTLTSLTLVLSPCSWRTYLVVECILLSQKEHMLSSPRFGMTYHRDLDATDVGELILKKIKCEGLQTPQRSVQNVMMGEPVSV